MDLFKYCTKHKKIKKYNKLIYIYKNKKIMKYKEFPKLSRWSRDIIITEKLDGTNASIFIQAKELEESDDEYIIAENENFTMRAGSRTRWITPKEDNYGFAKWVVENADELFELGEGQHFGEYWGQGIQRKYGLSEKRFSLFNTSRWRLNSFNKKGYQNPPKCCSIVPVLYEGPLDSSIIQKTLDNLIKTGSIAAKGFMNPEGIVIFHTVGNVAFKKTCVKDELNKYQLKNKK